MLVIVAYDVNTTDPAGAKRLRMVAKECVNFGHRVQSSVFECYVDSTQLRILKQKLMNIINEEKDKLSFYSLGNNYQSKVEYYGRKDSIDLATDVLFV